MTPSAQTAKRDKVERMFNAISGRYDLLNHLLSFGIDRRWRKKLVRRLQPDIGAVLDVATGTGDLAIAAAMATQAQVTATDIAEEMMEVGRKKTQAKGLQQRITFVKAAGEDLPLKDNTFDAVTIAFGIRNFENPAQGLSECFRVLRPEGQLLVLEFSMPRQRSLKGLYRFYFGRVLPWIGRLVSKHPDAYHYLPDSVDRFPYRTAFIRMLEATGFVHPTFTSLSGGIVMLYEARKP